jgi:hypothetical protein
MLKQVSGSSHSLPPNFAGSHISVSVSDPDSLIPDPYPAFQAAGSKVLMTKNWKKCTAEKN